MFQVVLQAGRAGMTARQSRMKGLCAWCVKALRSLFVRRNSADFQLRANPCEIIGGDGSDVLDGKAYVQTEDGADKTAEFIAGANAVLALAKECGVKSAILKAKSPSCGCGRIYNGCFRGELRPGYGVTAALLERNGIHVQTEE